MPAACALALLVTRTQPFRTPFSILLCNLKALLDPNYLKISTEMTLIDIPKWSISQLLLVYPRGCLYPPRYICR